MRYHPRMRVLVCKRCQERMWDDGDGSIFCGSCGWEAGTLVDDDPLPEVTGQHKVFDNYPEYVKNLHGIF